MKYLFYALLFMAGSIYGQDVPDPIQVKSPIPGNDLFTTPDVASFHKYNFLKPNLYTGTVSIQVPIHTISSGGINIPIALNYDARGVKIDEYSSNLGLGWSLNAGGNISKIVKDIEDFDYSVGTWTEPDDDFGYITSAYIASRGSMVDCLDLTSGPHHIPYTELPPPYNNSVYTDWESGPCYNPSREEDASPDQFVMGAPGISGNFYFEQDNNNPDLYHPKELSPKGLKFEGVNRSKDYAFNFIGYDRSEINGTSYLPGNWKIGALLDAAGNSYAEDYDQFEVTNTNGIKYFFGGHSDIIESMSSYATNFINPPTGSEAEDEAKNLEVNYYKISKNTWYLDKIEDPITNRVVTFDYETYSLTTKERKISLFDDTYSGNLSTYNGSILSNVPNYFEPLLGAVNEYHTKRQRAYTKSPRVNRLKEISFDNGKVEFFYDHVRQDKPGENALTKIIVKDNFGQVIKIVELNYLYFNSTENCSDPECKRLRLDKVVFKGSDDSYLNEYSMEYYNPDELPNVGSAQQDYLGYFNDNGVTMGSNDLKTPKLYFHENMGRFSILPFPLSNSSSTLISAATDSYSIQSNPNTMHYGSLKKIIYPTGGYSEFTYEPHTFRLLGADYTGGGIRIQSQRLDDGMGNAYFKEYEYLTTGNNSSGSINNLPIYGSLLTYLSSTGAKSFLVYNKSKSALELTNGSFVGYSRVIERQVNLSGASNGKVESIFTNSELYPNEYSEYLSCQGCGSPHIQTAVDYLINNSAYPYVGYIDNDIKRGKLLTRKTFNATDNLLVQEDYQYLYRQVGPQVINLNFKNGINQYDAGGSSFPGALTLEFDTELRIEQNLVLQGITQEYFDTGNTQATTNYTYGPYYPFLKEKIENNGLFEYKDKYYYPGDTEVNGLPYVNDLLNQNRLVQPLRQELYKDNSIVEKSEMEYHDFYNNNDGDVILPKVFSFAKGSGPLVNQEFIDKRDSNGNIMEYHTADGTYHCILWGYNKSYPIAKIEGIAYDDLPEPLLLQIGSLSNQDSSYEGQLITKLQELRDHPDLSEALVRSYTYKPLVGISTETDDRGYTVSYVYDSANRLEYIKDADGNVLSKNEYNYKPSN